MHTVVAEIVLIQQMMMIVMIRMISANVGLDNGSKLIGLEERLAPAVKKRRERGK